MNSPISLLVIGLVVSFATGFLVGHATTKPELVYPYPSNYDPARAQVSDAIKATQENVKNCYAILTEQLQAVRAELVKLERPPQAAQTTH